MRCTSCGLPLSPARTTTSCPRCGTHITSDKKPFPQTESWRPVAPQPQLSDVVGSPMALPESDSFRSPGAHVQSPVTFPPLSPAAPTYIPQPTPQLDQLWIPTPVSQGNKGSNVQLPQVQEHGWAGAKNQELPHASPLHQPWQPRAARVLIDAPTLRGPLPIPDALRAPTRSKNNFGFFIAGLCVIMGGLILVFVYFMAIGLPGNSTNNNTVKKNAAQTSSPTAVSSPTPSATATSFPGQKYIDNAQMAINIDPTSHQPTQLTTTFKTNQRMYITFQLHPGGQSGAACLLWYMNNKEFSTYALPVYPNERATSSYANYDGTGSGYVEIYWASTTKCSDKILAQHVDFTITT